MNDIPRGTSSEEILRSFAPSTHEDPTLNYEIILKNLKTQPALEDSKLDDSLTVATLEFNETPEWFMFLHKNAISFPHKSKFGTIWIAEDMRSQNFEGQTAFVRAVIAGRFRYAEMLAEFAETNVESPDQHGRTALHWASIKQLPDMITLCLAVGIDSSKQDHDGLTAFDIFCQTPNEKILTAFYKHVFEIEKSDPDAALLQLLTLTSEPEDGPEFPGEALFGPVISNKQPLVEAMMRAGVNLSTKNSNGETALHLAAKHGHAVIVSTLLQNSSRGVYVDMEAVSKDGSTALHYAAQGGYAKAVTVLLNHGADTKVEDNNGHSASDHATKSGYDDTQRALHTGSADQTTLHRAAVEGRVGRVRQILAGGGELEARDNYGRRALHIAARGGHQETVDFLLALGADLEAKDKNDMTALHLATEGDHSEMVKVLVGRGAELEAKGKCQMTALHYAAKSHSTGAVIILLDQGVELEAKDFRERTALHYAAENRDAEMVKVLLNRGAKLEGKDANEMTALMLCRGNPAIVALLKKK